MIYENLLGQLFLMEITGDRSCELLSKVGLQDACIRAA